MYLIIGKGTWKIGFSHRYGYPGICFVLEQMLRKLFNNSIASKLFKKAREGKVIWVYWVLWSGSHLALSSCFLDISF